ncbi:MAG TPA: hypothetical protein VMY42_19815 [Thermoguttaceae bacterium]|nr:hypothetical protein [Thermoguttaceae bacterium]
MRAVRRVVITLIIGGLLASGRTRLRAEEPAASDHLPAAVEALGIEEFDLLTAAEAKRIRATGGWDIGEGVMVQFAGTGRYEGAALALAGIAGGENVSFVAESAGVRIITKGTAYSMGSPRIQGILATETGTFGGTMLFAGNVSSMNILALPGIFVASFE